MQTGARKLASSPGNSTDHEDDDFARSASDQDDIASDDDVPAPEPSASRLRNSSIYDLTRKTSFQIYPVTLLSALLIVISAPFLVTNHFPNLEPWLNQLWYILRELVVFSFIGCMTSVMISYFGARDFGKKALWFVGLATVLAILTLSISSKHKTAEHTNGLWETPAMDDYSQIGSAGERQICNARLADFYAAWTDSEGQLFCGLPVHQTHSFAADRDTYGIGVRGGLYLQWLAALIANNFLAGTSREIQKVGLCYSVVICWKTLLLSRRDRCVFSIEIEIVHWLFWSSVVCFFASAPSRLQLILWKLDLVSLIMFLVSGVMAVHGVRYLWSTQGTVFQRVPCGSWHIWGFPVLDTSETFEILRHRLRVLLVPIMAVLTVGFCLLALGCISELIHTIKRSPTFLRYLGQAAPPKQDVVATKGTDSNSWNDIPSQSLLHRALRPIQQAHHTTRDLLFPSDKTTADSRPLTPTRICCRIRHRVGLLTLGLSSILLSIAAVELTLSWNNVANIYSLETDIEYLILTVAVISVVNVCCGLGQQELGRRQRIRRQQARRRELDPRTQKSTDRSGVDAEIFSFGAAVRYAWGSQGG
ncbi:hypothetical protein GGR57DRAFT_498239 [Xylariaceae sp. FL1272]|nr:hypothetical protein GGR57DRAFT_498239 [Xylariaceae sp. FL1272]